MLVDQTIIQVRSGKGGDGCMSFRREKYIPKGGPDGGDGGRGGDVILLADPNVATLLDLTSRHHWFAEDGRPGQGKQKIGRDGESLTIALPPGTLVYDDDSGELLIDMDEPGKEYVIARGGAGGYGNEHFATSTRQVPRITTPGKPGEEYTLRLELKIIADIGLIGKPNAGKSTLLSKLSKARPKIANYPFTTLEPNLGIAELSPERRLVLADIPGLIEGASTGQGLGNQFLRHVERTRLLVHLIEVEPMDGSDPIANYQAIRKELAEHSKELAEKPEVIVLSKAELLGREEDIQAASELISQALQRDVLTISSATGYGLERLLETCWNKVAQSPGQGRAVRWSTS